MSVVAQFRTDVEVLRETLAAVPDVTVTVDSVQWRPDGPTKAHIEAGDGDLDAFEAALAVDPTVEAYRRLTDGATERLYTVTLSADAEHGSSYLLIADVDGQVLDMSASGDTIHVRARFPSRRALFRYRESCRARGLEFRLGRLFTDTNGDATPDGELYGISEPQREALVRALEMGYFELPRRTTQEAIAADLGISTQALSARLRRGQSNLLTNTLADESAT